MPFDFVSDLVGAAGAAMPSAAADSMVAAKTPRRGAAAAAAKVKAPASYSLPPPSLTLTLTLSPSHEEHIRFNRRVEVGFLREGRKRFKTNLDVRGAPLQGETLHNLLPATLVAASVDWERTRPGKHRPGHQCVSAPSSRRNVWSTQSLYLSISLSLSRSYAIAPDSKSAT